MTKEIFSWDTHYLAFTLVLRMRLTWVRKFPIYKRSKIDYLTLAWDQSPVIAWGGGGGGGREWGEGGGAGRRILGLNGMLFRGIRSIIQWDNQILRFPPTHLSPQAINMTDSLTENFDAFTDLSCRGYLKHFLTQQFSSVCFSVTVPPSSDSFWSNLKSQFTGRSHRALFEESLKEIYRNMYNTVKEAHY